MSIATIHYIVATAGHVDHGKSALVRALTGTDPDRLPEEKARGITIELGFAHLALPHPTDSSSQFELGVVDVPGHEDFVKNMVAGVGSIDLALLVVAADDGWMPQTEEHLLILDYLGVTHGVVALTKCDLAPDTRPALDALRARLANSPFASAPIVPTSVLNVEGLDELKRVLALTLTAVPPPGDSGQPRLPIDRAFSLPGAGTIVTGTLTGGLLTQNQAVIVQPTGRVARIRALQTHGRTVGIARPGMRTALNIPEAPLAGQSLDGAARGQVVTIAELGEPTRSIDVELRRSGRGPVPRSGAGRPLKDGTRIRLHHGSTNVAGRVRLHTPLVTGERCLAQIRLETPLFVLAGDRFILRDWPEQATLAGGVVLDLNTAAFCNEMQQHLLRSRARQPADPANWILSQILRDRVCARGRLLSQTRFSRDQIAAAAAGLIADGQLVDLGPLVAEPQWWTSKRNHAMERVRQVHAAHPERPGLALTELRGALGPEFSDPTLFDAVVMELCRHGFIRDQATVRDRAHQLALPPPLQAAAHRLRAELAAQPLEPPAKSELAPDPISQQALRFLVDTGEAVTAGPDLVLLATAMARARQLIRQHIRKHGAATASALRQALNTNRRVIIPLLEQFDRDGFTVRHGDRRALRDGGE